MTPWLTDALAELVGCESPSSDPAATHACGELFAEFAKTHLDATPEVIVSGCRSHLRFTWGSPRVLLLGHLDTVWPHGTLARWPFTVDGDVATGPGVFDMKAGVIQALAALTMLPDLDGVRLLLTSDEELGSPTSADLVVDSARGCAATLVCEPSAAGDLKTARKGIALYQATVAGRAAHAGLEPEKGANAGLALAHFLVATGEVGAPERGTTVTPTVLSAGTTSNTVPAHAKAAIDVRAADPAELERVEQALKLAGATAERAVPGCAVTISGGINRPPMTESKELFQLARRLGSPLGLQLAGVAVGGGSDGNFTAGAGIPTLDGLGAVGDGAHAEGEHVLLSAMEPRARLLAALVTALR